MLKKTVEIATPGTRLSVEHRQLVITRPEHPPAQVPLEDLGVVIIDDARATYTQAVFTGLLEAGATVVITGPDHLPVGMMLPMTGHHTQTERHLAQCVAPEPRKKRIWQTLIRSKISQQATMLDHFTGHHSGLKAMADRVRSGDPDNLEAQAAQRYWPVLFGPDFRRDRDADGINAALNYGYAVVRSAVARAVVGAGLIPSLGVFHRNRGNPFCLADDLLEPFRPYVDWRVKDLARSRPADAPALSLQDRAVRASLLTLFNETVTVDGRRLPLLLAVQAAATSLMQALTAQDLPAQTVSLSLPSGLPLGQDTGDDDTIPGAAG